MDTSCTHCKFLCGLGELFEFGQSTIDIGDDDIEIKVYFDKSDYSDYCVGFRNIHDDESFGEFIHIRWYIFRQLVSWVIHDSKTVGEMEFINEASGEIGTFYYRDCDYYAVADGRSYRSLSSFDFRIYGLDEDITYYQQKNQTERDMVAIQNQTERITL